MTANSLPDSWLWPPSRLGEAVAALLNPHSSPLTPPSQGSGVDTLARWIESAALTIGYEAQPVETTHGEIERSLARMAPALICVPSDNGPAFLALAPGSKILAPDSTKVPLNGSVIRSALCADIEAPVLGEAQETLERAKIPTAKQTRAREAILRERLRSNPIRGIWLLRLPPGASFRRQLSEARVPQRLAALAAAHAVQYLLWILAWYLVGSHVLKAQSDRAWLVPWGLLLLTLVPLRVFITQLQGWVAIGAGVLLKQRLFVGALRLDPDRLRHQGAGQLLGRVLESEAVENLALSGGFLALVALIELFVSIFVLWSGAGGWLQSALLIGWLAVAAAIGWRYFHRLRDWTGIRLSMTHDLVESMSGHRTRLAQLPADRWHEGEDETLVAYAKSSEAMDRSTAHLIALIPRGWLTLGLIGMMPALAHGNTSSGGMAIAVGGVLLAYRAWRRLASGAWQIAGAAVAWRRTSVLFQSAAREELPGSLNAPIEPDSSRLVEARNLVFRYDGVATPVLSGASLKISEGDRVVLQGPSGGGKSTLVSLLAGVRKPDSGEILIGGSDRATLGAAEWRRRLAAAPQFHENHVLAETFSFNLFLGHPRVLTQSDLENAQQICRELGLGDLLSRMPAGMQQMAGETGWQLSHGERSRLYIARTLLQNADLVILDESFAALDPENLKRAIECVTKRARSLLIVEHD